MFSHLLLGSYTILNLFLVIIINICWHLDHDELGWICTSLITKPFNHGLLIGIFILLRLQPDNFISQLAGLNIKMDNILQVLLLSLHPKDILKIIGLRLISVKLLYELITKYLNELSVANDHEGYDICHQAQGKIKNRNEQVVGLLILLGVNVLQTRLQFVNERSDEFQDESEGPVG